MKLNRWISGALTVLCLKATAATLIVPMQLTEGDQTKNVGSVKFMDTQYGMLIRPNLHDLPPGVHGFHIHEKPSCGDHGMAAGGHLDPLKTQTHLGPYQNGHRGDMSVLIVDSEGNATLPLLAPRLKVASILGASVMVHAGGDNYSNTPSLGGGGERIVCGTVPKAVG